MMVEKLTLNGKTVAIIEGKEKVLTDTQSALDLIMAAKYEAGTNFFILRCGLAGEVLQKFVNYQVKIAVFGDFSQYTSKPLRDFFYESNKGKDIFFVSTKEKAVERLVEVG